LAFALNSSGDVIALRPNDGVRISARRGSRGIEQLVVDLSGREDATHCQVALPSLPHDFRAAAGPVRLWMNAAYRDGTDNRPPFMVYVAGYRDGKHIGQERYRYFAGKEAVPITFAIDVLAEADRYQVVFYADRRYRGVLELGDIRVTAGRTDYGIGPGTHFTRDLDLERHWRQDGNRLVCDSWYGRHWAEMPAGWSLDAVHPSALAAADWILYSNLDKAAFGVVKPAPDPDDGDRRQIGSRTLLSYSLGTDSTAALTLLPDDTVRFYCQRAYRHYHLSSGVKVELQDPTPWDAGVARVPNTFMIPNTFELARVGAGLRLGFAHSYGYAAIGLLLADFTDAGTLAFGSVLEQVFLRSGNLFADVVEIPASLYNGLRRLVNSAGVNLALPTAGCSEVLTSLIADRGRFSGLAISCPRAAPDGTPCGTCFKCFRKMRLDGRLDAPDPDEAVVHLLEKYPLKSATSVVYAAQRSNFRHPAIDRYRDLDLGFLVRYFDYAVEHMLPPPLAAHVRGQFAALGIAPMTPDEERRLRTLGQVFWPESFSWSRAGLPDPARS